MGVILKSLSGIDSPPPGQAEPKKDLACPGDFKFQIPGEKFSFGQILNAFDYTILHFFSILLHTCTHSHLVLGPPPPHYNLLKNQYKLK